MSDIEKGLCLAAMMAVLFIASAVYPVYHYTHNAYCGPECPGMSVFSGDL